MPPKKKKPPSRLDEDDQELVDVFSYVELVQDCLERAEINQKACLEGIIKSDLALRQSQSDADIHFIVLVRRAELLLIAVKKRYDTSDLPAAHRNPLKSCINDCERVIARVSAADPISKGIYEQACTILRGAKEIQNQKTQSSKSVEGKGAGGTFQRYDPTKTLFRNVTKINPYLLQDVVNCYKRFKTVCRSCYYKHKSHDLLGSTHHCRRCKRVAHPLVLIPASQMCDNLFGAKLVAVPAPPKNHMTLENKHKPFQMCKKTEHKVCNDKSASGETWFAHSIEELVVWTIERHYDVTFNRYIEVYHQEHDPPDLSLFNSFGSERQVSAQRGSGTAHRHGHTTAGDQGGRVYGYYASECTFPSVASIPERLMWDVLNCYKNFKEYCKWCYYQRDERGVVVINRRNNSTMCSNCQQPWESVVVIPASTLCWNFGNFDELPIAPWPRDKPTRDPFEYCKKKDHYRCFRVYIDSFWYPHSVEELVIWTVEREKKCTFRQFMQKAIQMPSPVASPRQTPPPSSSTSAPVPISNSSERQAPSSYATASVSPAKKKGPPSPLSLSGQSPPPSFSSVAAGLSPKKPTSPMLKSSQPPKGGDFKIKTVAGQQTKAATVSPSPVRAQPASGEVFLSGGVVINRGQNVLRPGKLADITGPVDSYEQVGFPFIVSQSDGIRDDITTGSHDHFQLPKVFAQQTSNNHITLSPHLQHTTVGLKGVGAGGSGINTLAGSSSPVVASVSTRRNYRVASTSTDVLNPGSGSGVVVQDNRSSARVVTSKLTSGALLSSSPQVFVAATTSLSESSHNNNNNGVFDAATKPETVALKALYKFSEVNFKVFSDIPHSLLREMALCFKDKKLVCRRCFYGDRSISQLIQTSNVCSSGEHIWNNPVLVIPGCDLCDNEPLFKHGEHVAVPPLPPVAIIRKCEKRNHHKCFAQSLEADQRFAHSVEELVVWLVESEIECSFEQFVSSNGLLQSSETESSSGVSQPSLNRQETNFVPQQNLTVASVTMTTATPLSNATGSDLQRSRAVAASYTTDFMGTMLYDPKKTEFVNIKDIPFDLLAAVAECFQRRLFVCRICFFESQCTKLVSKIETKQMIMCEEGHTPWKQIKVVPQCKLCITPGGHAPIPPLPKHMKNSNIPFAVCKKAEHQTCYAMSRGTNPWFPHTVEELVIWTVERERGIDFEECYKEYLSDSAKPRSSVDNAPPSQTFRLPVTTEPHLPISRGQHGIHITGGAQGMAPHSKLLSQNGFKNALDLASLPQSRRGGGNFDYTSPSLTQPEPYHSGHAPFPGDLRFGSSSTQFDFPAPTHLPTGGGVAPIPGFGPPLGGSNSSSTNLGVGAPPSVNTGSAFANFFPALLSENGSDSRPQAEEEEEGEGLASNGQSVTDLFNLTAGLDHIPDDFENPLALGSNLNQENKSGEIESTWSQQNNTIASGQSDYSNAGLSLHADEKGSQFIHGAMREKHEQNFNVGEELVQSSNALGRMDSFGFSLSTDNSSSAVGTFDSGVNIHESNPSSSTTNVTATVAGDPNWPSLVGIQDLDTAIQTSSEVSVPPCSDQNNTVLGELDIPRMPNTEPYVLGRSAQLGSDPKAAADGRVKLSPKGKKKKKKGSSKASTNDASSQNGKETIDSNGISSQFHDSSDATKSDEIFQEELVRIEELKMTRANFNLSSTSTPTFGGVDSTIEFRSAGHTPPNVDDMASEKAESNTATSLEPFADVSDNGEKAPLHLSNGDMDVATGATGIEHLLQPAREETGVAPDAKMAGRSSLLGSIMAARASKGSESSTSVHNDVSIFKSLPPFVPAYKNFDDIEDESSQKVDESATAEIAPSEVAGEAEALVDDPPISSEDPPLFTKETTEQNVLVESETVASVSATAIPTADPGSSKDQQHGEVALKTSGNTAAATIEEEPSCATIAKSDAVVEQVNMKTDRVAPSLHLEETVSGNEVVKESSVDPYPQTISDGLTKRLSEWDLSQSSDDEFDLNIEGEDQTLQHVPIEDWGCTLSDSEN